MQIWLVGPILYNMGGFHSKGKKYHHDTLSFVLEQV